MDGWETDVHLMHREEVLVRHYERAMPKTALWLRFYL